LNFEFESVLLQTANSSLCDDAELAEGDFVEGLIYPDVQFCEY